MRCGQCFGGARKEECAICCCKMVRSCIMNAVQVGGVFALDQVED